VETLRAVALGGAIGLGAVVLMSVPEFLPRAVADEQPMRSLLKSAAELFPPAADPSRLLNWDFAVEPGTSVEPIRESTVRKIAYGRTTFVQVMETESGVYSSDGLDSPNVQYPGIVKTPRPGTSPILWFWGDNKWASATAFNAGSFIAFTPFEGGQLVVTDEGSCVVQGNSVFC